MTYDDLVALATELKDKLPDGVYPFACPVDFQTWYYQTVYANGGWILNDDATETGYGDASTVWDSQYTKDPNRKKKLRNLQSGWEALKHRRSRVKLVL